MLEILGGSTSFFHAMHQGFFITMLGHCCCIPQCHIHRRLAIALLMIWQRLCCWLISPWWWNIGGISSIVGDLGDDTVGAVAVPIAYLSLVNGVAGLRITAMVVWHVMRDWDYQSTISAYLSIFLLKLIHLLCQWPRIFVFLLAEILSETECLCLTSGMSCVRLFVPPLSVSLMR